MLYLVWKMSPSDRLTDREDTNNSRKLLLARDKKLLCTCPHCKNPGQFKKNCRKFLQSQSRGKQENKEQAAVTPENKSYST